MQQLETIFEEFPIPDNGLPDIDVTFSGCRLGQGKLAFDVIDFKSSRISRWTMPHFETLAGVKALKKELQERTWPLDEAMFDIFWSNITQTHIAQIPDDDAHKKIFVCTGNLYCGICVLIVDTETNQTSVFPYDFDTNVYMYCPMGDFSPDGKYWMFIRWPLADSLEILAGQRDTARCQIGRVDVRTLETEIIYELDNVDQLHQLTCSDDGRYIVFTPFVFAPKIPYPAASAEEDPKGYRRCHEAGLYTSQMTTVDLHTGQHWRTEIPIPVPAHFEPDPADPHIFYVSAHNFSLSPRKDIVLEGPGAIFKVEIREGETVVTGEYSDETFFRVTQHIPFRFEGRTLVAVTNLPNKVDIIDGETMTLWHRQEIFPSPPLDFSATGNIACPTFPQSCYSINPGKRGKFLVLEAAAGLVVLDVANKRLLEHTISRQIPENFCGNGHTRLRGH